MLARLTLGLPRPLARALPIAAGLAVWLAAAAAEACCNAPPPPPPPHIPSSCGCSPTITTPGVGVWVRGYVNGGVNVYAQAGASATATATATASAGAYGQAWGSYGGGWNTYIETAPAPGFIQNLQVDLDSDKLLHRTAYQAVRRTSRRVIFQAACLDDRGVPHPASQVSPERDIAEGYDGEIFRCIAGTRLQATWGDYVESLKLDHGEILACDKGQALWHAPGGAVTCRAQKPARDCNERSLLRRYGVGVKVLTLVREETYTDFREESADSSHLRVSGGLFSLDGGVGGYR